MKGLIQDKINWRVLFIPVAFVLSWVPAWKTGLLLLRVLPLILYMPSFLRIVQRARGQALGEAQ